MFTDQHSTTVRKSSRRIQAGQEINFEVPAGWIVEGAMVERIERFCGTINYFVHYTFQAHDGRLIEITGWVTHGQVRR